MANGVVTKYYYAGAQRIAMRSSGTLYFMLGDHLGSTSLVTFANGNVVSETRYKAWGEVRYASGNTPTKYQYTGQYSYASDFGLQFYNARWYDSSLSRFVQADSIIPGGVQGLDRYAYVNNSPVNYTDPSGHGADCGIGMGCVKDYSGASTLDDFVDMGWSERKHWLDDFVHEHQLGNWFDDIKSAIGGFMSKDPSLSDVTGATYYMDAAVLFEINNGWNISQHGKDANVGGDLALAGATAWATFFSKFQKCVKDGCNQDTLIPARLQGEDDGVNLYAWPMTQDSGIYSQDDEIARIELSLFLDVANGYRDVGIFLSQQGNYAIDPRTAGPWLASTASWAGPWGAYYIYGITHSTKPIP